MTPLETPHRWRPLGSPSLKPLIPLTLFFVFTTMWVSTASAKAAPQKDRRDWTLGATGARGWMDGDRLVSTGIREIVITEIAKSSPAHGKLEVGDVIVGLGGKRFVSDARIEFGRALTKAESNQRGRLVLTVRREKTTKKKTTKKTARRNSKKNAEKSDKKNIENGATTKITLELPVLGRYRATAPYDCPKSRQVLERGCDALTRKMKERSYRPSTIPRCLNALALLANGDDRHLDLVRREVRWAAKFSAERFQTWTYGYVIMLLAEYVIATGDDSVRPGLRRLAREAANGQSAVGSWGHRFARDDGRLHGYGMMNAPGVPLTISLVMARLAGVKGPDIDRAIERSTKLLRFYLGKGAVPYGDHHPWIQTHEDNGKCGMAAVLFDLVGDAPAAEFFSRMSVASHGAERDTGHTGNYWNILWAMPGVSRSGRHATGAWMKEFGAWSFDLARKWDGTFVHQGPPQQKKDQYDGWDATGAYLLAYAVAKRKIVLTGRRPSNIPQIEVDQARSLIVDGRGWSNTDRKSFYDGLHVDELVNRLRSWSPVVRERAAMALGRRGENVVPQLLTMLESPELEARYGACQALAHLGQRAVPAVTILRTNLRHDDMWLRVKAAEALARIGPDAMSAAPELLVRLAESPSTDDPRGMEQRYLCFALFDRRRGLLRHSLDDVDPAALDTAVRAGLRNEDGRARGAVSAIYRRLPLSQLRPLLPAILRAVKEPSPSGIMFANEVRMEGLRLLAKHRIREGIEVCADYVQSQKQHGSEKRTPKVLDILRGYGVHAQAMIPKLERIADFFDNAERDFPKRLSRRKARAVRDAVRVIRSSEDRPKLNSIESPGSGEEE